MPEPIETGYFAHLFSDPIYVVGVEPLYQEGIELAQKKHPIQPLAMAEEVIASTILPDTIPIPTVPKTEKPSSVSKKIPKRCLLLFTSENETLSASEKAFIDKVMTACALNPFDYECINFNGLTIHDIAERYAYTKLVLFNVSIQGLLLEKYKCTQVKSTQIVLADDVWMIESNANLKKLLWLQLKQLFEIA